MKNQPTAFEKSNVLDMQGKLCYDLILMRQKFIAIPREVFQDVISKRIIPTDIMVYMYLCSKCAHGKPVYIDRNRIRKDLGGVSLSKVSDSLKRLKSAGHIERRKLNGPTSTELLTFVKDKNNIFIKGILQNEDFSQI